MGAELVKDSAGISHIKLNDEYINSVNTIEEELKDYNIINIIGIGDEEDDNKYLTKKILSKKNNKIFVEKEIKIENELHSDNLINVISIIKKGNCPNIVKHYKFINKNNSLCIISEYLNNGDLLHFMNAYRDLGLIIEEKILWKIFLQCAAGLKYIHSKNIIHRNIKLDNIYITDNEIVKIGNFTKAILLTNNIGEEERLTEEIDSFLYRSPEMEEGNYGKKTDIYSLGVVFHKLCFYEFPKNNTMINDEIINKEKIPKKMIEIIELMLSEEKNRPDSNTIYELILKEYIQKNPINTSIEAVFKCLNCFVNLTKDMSENKNDFINEEKTPFCYNYIKFIEIYNNDSGEKRKEKPNIKIFLNSIRNLIVNEKNLKNINEEIKPKIILDYLLEYMNKEMNLIHKVNNCSFKMQSYDFDTNEQDALTNCNNYRNKFFNSIICKYFCGTIKTKRICTDENCQKENYCYNLFPYLEFNLDRCYRLNEKDNKYEYEPNISEWFSIQENHCKILSKEYNICCPGCGKIELQKEFKQIEEFPLNLIIAINRGKRNEYKSKLVYDTTLYINKVDDKLEYNLVGIIKRIEDKNIEKYISIIFDSVENNWIKTGNNTQIVIKNPKDDSEGDIIMLFYSFNKRIK